MVKKITLSILIPSYSYSEGIDRILSKLSNVSDFRFEIIISDDSPDDEVQSVVEKHNNTLHNIIYIKNMPSLGAVNNWNSLIAKAKGEYILVLHHDEFPLDYDFIGSLVKYIEINEYPDVVLLQCFLMEEGFGRKYLHAPNFLKTGIIKFFPSFLIIRNVIGPVSAFVFKAGLAEPFDKNLVWLVDVDFYYRILKKAKSVNGSPIRIGSTINRVNSITFGLRNRIKFIRRNEEFYLLSKYPDLKFWIKFRFLNVAYIILDIIWLFSRFICKRVGII
jgi:glycosyltransferase involved in cell wall biosynthesis